MSNFICEKCGASILDSDVGYITGCEHYPVKCLQWGKKTTEALKEWKNKKEVITMPKKGTKKPKGKGKGY